MFNREPVPEISVQELRYILEQNKPDFCLIDVREQKEWDIARIQGAALRPLSTFRDNYQDLPRDKNLYIHCKVGGRSKIAVQFLMDKGFTKVFNVRGGIDAWAKEIDPSMPKY
jgi:adenylyltransferase/sulfurtransferase